MSYALDTTKRKFHRILDAITNSSSSSLPLASPHNASSSSLGVHHAPKRARFERPQSAYSPSTTQTALNAERAKPLNAKITSETDEQPRMSYAPWDRGQFLDRLKTFSLSVVDWSPKLDVMNEVEWAKRGWKCVGKETVSCTGCAKRMIINLEVQAQPVADGEDETSDTERDASRENAYNELAEKYSRLLVNNHYEGCLWKRRGCDGMCYRKV